MLQLLMKLLDVPPSADQISFGTVLSACSESQSWELAIQLVQLMQASQARAWTPRADGSQWGQNPFKTHGFQPGISYTDMTLTHTHTHIYIYIYLF